MLSLIHIYADYDGMDWDRAAGSTSGGAVAVQYRLYGRGRNFGGHDDHEMCIRDSAMPAGAIQLEERIEKLVRDKKKAMQSRDYEHASVLRGSELELRSRLRAMLSAWTTEKMCIRDSRSRAFGAYRR